MTSPPSYRLRWSAQAERNADDVAGEIAKRDPGAAGKWIDGLVEHVENAATIPLAGRVVPELNRQDVRETVFGRYRVVYRVDGDQVVVVTVFAGERQGLPSDADPDAG